LCKTKKSLDFEKFIEKIDSKLKSHGKNGCEMLVRVDDDCPVYCVRFRFNDRLCNHLQDFLKERSVSVWNIGKDHESILLVSRLDTSKLTFDDKSCYLELLTKALELLNNDGRSYCEPSPDINIEMNKDLKELDNMLHGVRYK